MKRLTTKDFQPGSTEAEAIAIAKNVLLGATLCSNIDGKFCSGKIVEVEVYLEKNDKASHSKNGFTHRCASMFKAGGTAYVYKLRGYDAMNVAIGNEGEGNAILIRALEPMAGMDVMRERVDKMAKFFGHKPRKDVDLCRGCGRLGEAIGLDTPLHNGIDLSKSDELWIEPRTDKNIEIASGKRIGLGRFAGEDADRILRFAIKDNPWVSKPI